MTYAADKIYGRDDSTALHLWIHLGDGLHRRAITWAPRPDGICHRFAFSLALLVDGMILQELLRAKDKVVDESGCIAGSHPCIVASSIFFSLQKQWIPFLVGMIVGRRAKNMLVAATYHEQMAILDAGDKLHALVA